MVSCCGECDYDDCVAGEWGGGLLHDIRERDEAIREAVKVKGVQAVAECLGLTKRSVWRVLK